MDEFEFVFIGGVKDGNRLKLRDKKKYIEVPLPVDVVFSYVREELPTSSTIIDRDRYVFRKFKINLSVFEFYSEESLSEEDTFLKLLEGYNPETKK